MSRTVPRLVIGAGLAVLVGGALYLYAVRGAALLVDLAAMTRGILCF